MEEIICPHCGKANLATDRYCHQCLRPLVESTNENDEPDTKNDDVPEWLKRIRELKKMDEEREKEKEKWRQQALFGQFGEPPKNNPSPTEKKNVGLHSERTKSGAENKTPVLFQPSPDATTKSTQSFNQPSANSPLDQKDTLPEGFMPFEE